MFFNDAIATSKFPSSLKMINIKAVFKRGTKSFKETTEFSVSYLWFQKFLREL